MRIKGYIVNMSREIVFTLVMIIYLVQLNALNKELLSKKFDSSVALLQYNNSVAVKFFAGAILLFAIGCFLVNYRIRSWRNYDSYEEMIMMFLAIVITVVLLIVLIVFIDNPILRAVLTVFAALYGFAKAGK